MAGRRQHHIWQFLQRGFSWREHGDDQIFVYRKGVAPKQTVTRKFGWIAEFYGPEGSAADANITEFEGQVQSFLQDVRRMDGGVRLDPNMVAPIVAHLEMRSSFLRHEMSRIAERVVDGLARHFQSKPKLRALLTSYVQGQPEQVRDLLSDSGVPEEFHHVCLELIDVKLPNLITATADDLASGFASLFGIMRAKLAESAAKSHISSLENDFSETERAKGHAKLTYGVLRRERGSFVLPDTSLAIFKTSGLSPVSQKSDKIEAVLMPISTEVAVIGSSMGEFSRDNSTLRRALSSCSFEAFLAPTQSNELEKLADRIGKNASLVSDAELQKIIRYESLLKK